MLPGMILVVSLLLCVGYVVVTSGYFNGGNAAQDDAAADLERKIADNSADTETWMAYAQMLQGRGDFGFAAEAYRKVLEQAPFERAAQTEISVCYALIGDDVQLKKFLRDLAMNDAKLALEIMGRPELGAYMAGADFAEILAEARDQAND